MRRPWLALAGALLLALGLTTLLLGLNGISRVHDGDYWPVAPIGLAAASLVGFVWWEGRSDRPIVRLDLFRDPAFSAINAVNLLMNLSAFSVFLFVPYYFARFSDLPLPLAGAVLATTWVTTALTSPLSGKLIGRVPAERVAALGLLAVGGGLFLTGHWPAGASPLAMAATLAVQGVGVGLFQVSYLDIVMRSSPLADRGVAGSLGVLTRTIGTVSGATVLTLIFRALQGAVDTPAAFLTAFHGVFQLVGLVVAATMLVIPWWRKAG